MFDDLFDRKREKELVESLLTDADNHIYELETENEQLKQTVKEYNKKITKMYKGIKKQKQRVEKLQKDKDRVVNEREDLLSSCLYQDGIIKKAIEYIEENCIIPNIIEKEVLSILRGEDNE